jgi:hypothetical protein
MIRAQHFVAKEQLSWGRHCAARLCRISQAETDENRNSMSTRLHRGFSENVHSGLQGDSGVCGGQRHRGSQTDRLFVACTFRCSSVHADAS